MCSCFDVCWSFGVAGLGWYPSQPSHTETPTYIETTTHDQYGDTLEKSQAPDDGLLMSETC